MCASFTTEGCVLNRNCLFIQGILMLLHFFVKLKILDQVQNQGLGIVRSWNPMEGYIDRICDSLA